MVADSIRFTLTARVVSAETRRLGLCPPAFRSPPSVEGATRTIRRCGEGAMVAVTVRDRPVADIAADLIEGVIVANALTGSDAVRCRRRLTMAVDVAQGADPSPSEPGWARPTGQTRPTGSVRGQARVA